MKEEKTIEDRAKEYLASSECDNKHHINIMADFAKQEMEKALPSDDEIQEEFYHQINAHSKINAVHWLKQQILNNIK